MIVIKRRYRRTGRGFGNLFKEIVTSAISKATSPSNIQKVKQAAVNSALASSQQAIKKSVKRIIESGQSNQKTKKQKIDEILSAGGSGIVLD